MDSEIAQFVMVTVLGAVIAVILLPFIWWRIRRHPKAPQSREELEAEMPEVEKILKFGVLVLAGAAVGSFYVGRVLSGSLFVVVLVAVLCLLLAFRPRLGK